MENLFELQMSQAVQTGQSRENSSIPQVRSTEEAAAVAQEFESFFLSQMVQAMFTNVGKDNPFGGGAGERAFQGMLHEEYSKVMAQSGGLGLADRLTTEILRYQDTGDLA